MCDCSPGCEIPVPAAQRPVGSGGGKVCGSAGVWGCPCSPGFPVTDHSSSNLSSSAIYLFIFYVFNLVSFGENLNIFISITSSSAFRLWLQFDHIWNVWPPNSGISSLPSQKQHTAPSLRVFLWPDHRGAPGPCPPPHQHHCTHGSLTNPPPPMKHYQTFGMLTTKLITG